MGGDYGRRLSPAGERVKAAVTPQVFRVKRPQHRAATYNVEEVEAKK